MTGLRLAEFDGLLTDVLPRFGAAETARLTRAERQRAIGGGHPFDLTPRDQTLLTVVWLSHYPIHEVLGFLFDVSDSTVSRYIRRVLPCWKRQKGRRCACPILAANSATNSLTCSRKHQS